MNDGECGIKQNNSITNARERERKEEMPFHGGNRGSNPLGDANNINELET